MLSLKNSKNNIFWVLCIMGLFAILSSTMSKNPVLKPFASSLGTPEGFWLGFVASASTIPGILVSLPAASLSDIFGRRKMLLASSLVFASAPFLYLFITVWWQLILVRFYHGFATAIFVPVAEASIVVQFPTKRGERISLFSSATAVGRAIAPFLGGYILLVTIYNYYTLYLAVAVAGVTALVTGLLFLAEEKDITIKTKDSTDMMGRMLHGWSHIASSHGVLTASLVQASQYYAFGAVEYFFVGYLKDVVGLNAFLIGTITGSQIVILILAKPLIGRISDKIGRRAPILMGSIISGLPLFAIPFVSDFSVLLLLSVVYGFGFATVTACTSPLVSELVPKELVGASMGFLDTTMDVGQTLGPIIGGLILASALQYAGVFYSLGIVLLVAGAIFALSRVAKTK
jgi:MFS family permease